MGKNGVFGCSDHRPGAETPRHKDVNFADVGYHKVNVDPLKGRDQNLAPSTGDNPLPSMFKAQNPSHDNTGKGRSKGM